MNPWPTGRRRVHTMSGTVTLNDGKLWAAECSRFGWNFTNQVHYLRQDLTNIGIQNYFFSQVDVSTPFVFFRFFVGPQAAGFGNGLGPSKQLRNPAAGAGIRNEPFTGTECLSWNLSDPIVPLYLTMIVYRTDNNPPVPEVFRQIPISINALQGQWTGSWSVNFTVEQWGKTVPWQTTYPDMLHISPDGDVIASAITYYEMPVVGSPLNINANLGPLSASISTVFGNNSSGVPLDYHVDLTPKAFCFGPSKNTVIGATARNTGFTYGYAASQTVDEGAADTGLSSGTRRKYTDDINTGSVLTTNEMMWWSYNGITENIRAGSVVGGGLGQSVTKQVQLYGNICQLDGSAPPNTWDAYWVSRNTGTGSVATPRHIASCSGNFSDSDTQLKVSGAGVSINEYSAIRGYMVDPAQASYPYPYDKRWLIYGERFRSFTLKHLPSYPLPIGTWAGSTHTTAVSGLLTTTGGTGSATYTLPSQFCCEGYRYLRLVVQSIGSDNEDFDLVINGKTWHLTTGLDSVPTTLDVDLCAPDSGGVVGTQENRYPVDPTTWIPVLETKHWGINSTNLLTFSALRSGSKISVAPPNLKRLHFARASFLDTFHDRVLLRQPTDNITVKRYILGIVDGRQSLDVYATTYIAGIIPQINNIPGWVATQVTSGHPFYAPGALPQFGAFGQFAGACGRQRNGTMGNNLDCTTEFEVLTQARFDVVDVHPFCGDIVNGVGYGTYVPVQVWVGKITGLAAQGLVFTTGDALDVGVDVQVTTPASSGTAVTDSTGFAETPAPFPPGGLNGVLTVDSTPIPMYFSQRRKTRFLASVAPTITHGLNPFVLTDEMGRVYFVKCDTHRNVYFQRTLYSSPRTTADLTPRVQVTTTEDCSFPCLAWSQNDQLILVYNRDSGDLYARTSTDDGETWSSEVALITNVLFGSIRSESRDGMGTTLAWGVRPGSGTTGTIVGKYRKGGDTSWSSEYTFKDGAGTALSVEQDTVHLDASPDIGERWEMHYREAGATDTSHAYSVDDGITWTKTI